MLIYLASTVLMSKPEKIRKMINFECFKSTKEWSLQIFDNNQNKEVSGKHAEGNKYP